MTTVPLRNALLGLLLLLVASTAQAQAWIPLDLGDGATTWMRTGAATGLTISGNTGAAGATVRAGGVSVVSDAAGNYALALPAGTYAVTSEKSGCSFIPASQSVTLGPSKTGVSFTTPCSLSLPSGVTTYANNYIKNYPYDVIYWPGSSVYRWQNYFRRWTSSDNTGGGFCQGHQETCLTNIPYPVYSGGASYDATCGLCPGVWKGFNSVSYPHPRVRIGNGEPIWMGGLAGTDTAGYDYTAINQGYLYLTDQIIVMDPIGSSARSTSCNYACSDLSATTLTWDPWGAAARKVYPGEITPNYWGIVPRDDTAYKWQTLVARGGSLDPEPTLYTAKKGNGYVFSQQFLVATPVFDGVFGGGDGPTCVSYATQCWTVDSGHGSPGRAKIELIAGEYYVFISGYATNDDGILRNLADSITDLATFAGTGTVHSTLYNTVLLMNSLGISGSAHLVGHSLGAMDVLALYKLGYGGSVVAYSVPSETPNVAILPRASNLSGLSAAQRPVTAFSGSNDPISNPFSSECGSDMHTCRVKAGVTEYLCNTGGGFLSGDNPHNRLKYQICAGGKQW